MSDRRKDFIEDNYKKGMKVGELLDKMCKKFTDYSRADNLRFIREEFVGKKVNQKEKEVITTECPQCDKTAKGEEEIEGLFGWRMNRTRPQSWCKECRNQT